MGVGIDFSGFSSEREDVGDRNEAEDAGNLRFAGLAPVTPKLVCREGAALWVVTYVTDTRGESPPAGLAPDQLARWRSTPAIGAESPRYEVADRFEV